MPRKKQTISDENEAVGTKIKNEQSDEIHFSSAFDPNKLSEKNKNIQSITENFNIDFSAELTSFVGRVFELQFSEMKYIETRKILEQKAPMIFSSFNIGTHNQNGLITFEPLLLHKVINFLFGADGQMEDDIAPVQFGQCALKIARKIAEIALGSLQKAAQGIHDFNVELIDSSNNPKAIRSQKMPDKAYQMAFNISGMAVNNAFYIIFPENFIEQITYQVNQEGQRNQNELPQANQFQTDIIGSSVELVALLPEIRLKLSDVMSLKSGDLIPIDNPETVDLKLGQKIIHRAIVGQANDRRVVKITQSLNSRP